MATTSFISCGLALENNTRTAANSGGFGNIDPLTGIPTWDAVGASPALAFKTIEMLRSALVTWGTPNLDMREDETRSGPHDPVPDPITMRDCTTGKAIQHLTGDISLKMRMRGLGSAAAYATNKLMPWVQAMNSGMALFENSGAAAVDTLAAAALTANTFTAATPASYKVGGMLVVKIAGHYEVSWVTKIATAVITHTPAFSVQLETGHVVQFADSLYISNTLATGDSVALQLITLESKTYAFGCRMKSAKIVLNEKQPMLEIVLQSAHIRIERAASTPLPTDKSNGAVPLLIGSYTLYTSVVDGTVPEEGSRTVPSIDVDSLVISIENTLAPTGYTGDLIETTDWEVVDSKATCEFTLGTPDATLDDMVWNEESRGFHFGHGPCGVGNGFGVGFMSANATIDTKQRDISGDTIRQKFMLRSDLYAGDDSTDAQANVSFKLGLTKH